MRKLSLVSLLFFSVLVHSYGETEKTEINGLAWPALSPDGETLAFEWLNDLWIAPSGGGEAKRIVKDPAREAYPKFTRDGKRLVFSSERSGSAQIYSVDLDGGGLKAHTNHTEGNILEAVSPDGSYALVRGERERSGYKPFRLMKVDLRKNARELSLFDATAHSASISPDGKRFLFCRGGEQLYRKGYTGSRASAIHLFDETDGSFKVLVSEDHEARSPLWKPDGNSFYYVSGRDGVLNVWTRNLADGRDAQLTFFNEDGVVLPVLSGDGRTMVFRAGQDVFRFEPDGKTEPVPIRFFTREKVPASSQRKEKVTGTSYAAFSKDGAHVVFTAAGDLWTMGKNDKEPKRLTATDDRDEREPVLSPDGKTLCFLEDDGLSVKVCVAAWDGQVVGEIAAIPGRPHSKRSLQMSPDGSMLSWLEATGDLVTVPITGGEPKVVMENWDMPTYDWSPSGEWLVVAAKDMHSNRDIWVVRADGSLPVRNLTMHPDFEGSPKWSPDGKSILFTSRRDGDGLARFWLADVEELDAFPEKAGKSLRRISTDVSEPMRACWSEDSKSVLFQSRDRHDEVVYSLPVDGGEVSEYAGFRGIPEGGGQGVSFWRIDRVPTVFENGECREFKFSFSVEQDRRTRLKLGFRRIWRTLKERFYDETMNGKDWDAILAKYEEAATRAMDSRQFDRVIAQLLGELNASHLTFKAKKWGVKVPPAKVKNATAHPGLVFRNTWDGPLVIDRVIGDSLIAKVVNAPVAGERVKRIGGKDVDARTPLDGFFNGAVKSPLPMVLVSKEGVERTLELIPVSYETARRLDREAKVENARAVAADKGEITYLPFRRMKTDDLRDLETEVYRASLDSKGLILDLRDNAGGRVADELLGLFCQPVHTFTIPRGGPRGYPTDRRVSPSWEGAMVVLCNGNTFSNAEIFCHAYKRLKRGALVGMPTNGGVISAVGISIPEVGELQIPFRGWFHVDTGKDLELNGAVPDVIVAFPPEAETEGTDPQLSEAIRVVGEEISKLGSVRDPVYKIEGK